MKKLLSFIVIATLSLALIACSSSSSEESSASSNTYTNDIVEENSIEEPIEEIEDIEEIPKIEFANDLEASLYQIIIDNNAEFDSINTEEDFCSLMLFCKNDEDVVNMFLGKFSEVVQSYSPETTLSVIFNDIDEKDDDDPSLLLVFVNPDGTTEIVLDSPDYNSAHNIWVNNQFSVWDGAHTDLEDIIVKQLNDEKSYKHIETTYREITYESDKEEVNAILSDAGYTQRVEINDLLIITQFSAKNAFNATIKNTAIGIASYSNNTIELIAIE